MALKREAKTLRDKAISSLRRAIACFNSYDEDGRITSVLLHLQHSAEMLLKSVLVQKGTKVFDKSTGVSIGFEKCLRLAASHGLTAAEAGTLRAVDSLRDAAQHWIVFVDEQILYLHARAIVTCIDDILKRDLEDDLASHLPARVLPISSVPPAQIDFLIDRQFAQIADLLAPGRRARDEARGRIRALLALESHVTDEVAVSEKDIDRIEIAIRQAKPIADIFPRLQGIATNIDGDGVNVRVHFSKKEGAPVRLIGGDDLEEAGAVREIDLQKKFYMGRKKLAARVGLTEPKSTALRVHLNLDADPNCMHVFKHGASEFPSYSDNALQRMKQCLANESIQDIWREYQQRAGFGGRRKV